jgi:hypothetical protein
MIMSFGEYKFYFQADKISLRYGRISQIEK